MKNMDEVVKKLYDNLITVIIKDFEMNEIETVKNEFLQILKNRYSKSTLSINDYDALYEKLFKLEYNEWENLPLGMKKHILLNDDALDEIINITSIAFKYAKDRLNNNILISVSVAEEYIIKLKQLFELVKEYNKELAVWHISEGMMDLKYSSGQTENMSLRIGRMK